MNERRKFSQALPCQLVRKNDKSIVVPVVEDGRERMKGSIGQKELARSEKRARLNLIVASARTAVPE